MQIFEQSTKKVFSSTPTFANFLETLSKFFFKSKGQNEPEKSTEHFPLLTKRVK